MKKLTSMAIALGLVFVVSLAAHPAGAQGLPRQETFYIAGQQWGPPTNFNPVHPNPGWPTNPTQNMMWLYEALFGYNMVTGEMEPILAEKMEWTDPYTVVVTLREGTRFQDGEPLTAQDVAYTFELSQRHAIGYSNLWETGYLTKITVQDDRTLTFHLNPDRLNPGVVLNALGTIRILPEHLWVQVEQAGDVPGYANLEPVGSGPYKLHSYTSEQIILERDDAYWGIPYFGTPAPKYVVHPIFRSNDAANLAFERGQVDLHQVFLPQIWTMQARGVPVGSWFQEEPYHLPATTPSLIINIQRKPLDNPLVRRALAHSINYALIAQNAMSRYSPPASSSLIVPVGVAEQQYFDEELVAQYGWEYNPQKAIDILEKELGATRGSDGIYVLPDGTRLGPFYVEAPYGWTDWMTALEIVAQGAQAVGIDVRTQFPEAPVWNTHLNSGEFDLIMYTPGPVYGPNMPWLRFQEAMDGRGVAPVGQPAFRAWNRYYNEEVNRLLDQVAAETDPARLHEFYRELDRIYMEDIPLIVLMYRPAYFYLYNESVWTGFPSAENPYAPPQFGGAGIKVIYHLEPAR